MRSSLLLPLALVIPLLACSSEPDTGGSGGSGASGGSGGSGGAPPPSGPITGTVKHYSYAFDLEKAHAKAALDVDVAAPGGDCFGVPCLPPATAITWNDAAPVSGTVADGALAVCGAPPVGAGDPLRIGAEVDVIEKTYLAGLDVGFSRTIDQAGGEFAYLLSWVGGCHRFGPCDDDPSKMATYHFDITHPSGTVVLCPGKLTAGDTLTSCDLDGTLAPTYSAFGFAADPLWKRSDFVTAAGVDLVFYETPNGVLASKLDAASVSEYMTWITDLLGPFPYGKELRFAGAPTAWLGFEHPANIILSEQLDEVTGAYLDPTMHVLMHETAHQWAGDRATIATVADFVWKEATAEYLAYVFEDEHRPPGEADTTRAYWDAISLQAANFPRPTDDPTPPVQSFYGDVYGPGPMVLYVQLEALFGRKAILDAVKAFLADPGAKAVSELQEALEKTTGQSLQAYFDAWVFGAGEPEWPTFAITTAQAGDQVTVTVTQQNPSKKVYGCKFEVEVSGATQKALATIDYGAAPTNAVATATVTLAEPVAGTVLDPSHRLVGRAAGGPLAPPNKLRVWLL